MAAALLNRTAVHTWSKATSPALSKPAFLTPSQLHPLLRSVAIFEVLHKFHDFSNDAVSFAAFSEAHALFLKREFKQAYELFHTLSEKYPEDKPSKRFKEICLRFMQNPELAQDNFDVTKMTEK